MHTFNTKSGARIHFNPDMSGYAHVTNKHDFTLEIPCEDLVDFVAMLVRDSLIAEVEDDSAADAKISAILLLSSHELLGLKP